MGAGVRGREARGEGCMMGANGGGQASQLRCESMAVSVLGLSAYHQWGVYAGVGAEPIISGGGGGWGIQPIII